MVRTCGYDALSLLLLLLQLQVSSAFWSFLYPESFSVEVSIIIDRPIDQVFGFCSNFQNDKLWRVDVIEISCLELCDSVQVGSKYKETANLGTVVPFLPTIDVFPIISVLDPTNYRIKWVGTDRDYSVERQFKVVDADSTKITAIHSSTLKETLRTIFIPIPIPIIQWIYSMGRNKELRELKAYIESNL